MPSAPRASGRRLATTFAVLLIALPLAAAPAHGDPARALGERLRDGAQGAPGLTGSDRTLAAALEEVELRVRQMAERSRGHQDELDMLRAELARGQARVGELEQGLAESESAREDADAALEQARGEIARLEGQLAGLYARLTTLSDVLSSAEGSGPATVAPAPRRQAAAAAPAAAFPAHVRARLKNLDAEATEAGQLISVRGDRLFNFDSSAIKPAAQELLAEVAELLRYFADDEVLIVGHTDSTGDSSYNQFLSEERAAAVKTFFAERFGIAPARMRTMGMGDRRPSVSNATPEGRRANRRVEVLIEHMAGDTHARADGPPRATY